MASTVWRLGDRSEPPSQRSADYETTSLAAMQATGKPAWAALSTSGLRSLDLPHAVREVIVLADGDEPGAAAAQDCAKRCNAKGEAFGSPARQAAWISTICSRPATPF